MNDLRDRLERLAATPMQSTAIGVFDRARNKADKIRRRRRQRRVSAVSAAVVAVAVVFAIHALPDRHGLNIEATRSPSTTSTKLATYQVDAMVLQVMPARPELCIRIIVVAQAARSDAQSQVPPCGGPPIDGWDWTYLTGEHRSGRTIWGTYHVVGTYDGATFTLTRRPGPPSPHQPHPVSFATPCATPPGGWVVTNPSRFSLDDLKAMNAAALSQPDYAGMWTDTSTPVNGRVNLFPEQVLTFAFTGTPTQHRTQLTALWGGPICVVQHAHTRAALDQVTALIQGAVGQRLGLQVLEATRDEVNDRVNVTTIIATADMRRAVDRRFGAALVRLTPILTTVTPTPTTITPTPTTVAPGVTLNGLPLGANATYLSDARLTLISKGTTTIEVTLADGGQIRLVINRTADSKADLKVYQETFGGQEGTLNGSPSMSGFSMSPGWQTIAWAPTMTVTVTLHYQTSVSAALARQLANGVTLDEGNLS